MTNIINGMRALCPISESTIRTLREQVEPCFFPKRYRLVQADGFCHAAYFIERGMTRSFWLVNGEEITTSFSTEGGIVFSMDELYYGKPSEEFVETLEEVEAYRIALSDLRRLFETNLELANWGRIIHQNEYRRLHRSHKERLTLPARERYEAFCRQFPDVCRRAQLGYVASYLGITLSTLSRIRSGERRTERRNLTQDKCRDV
ncbi:MAG TPA: Crp/Fnr family transcriptional regulator [Candidatus Alistipes intestinipullorum]|nr:Crp/Fnr family transcriptional regulator [Candidatus Alistipes intestinipullorum]